MDADEERLNEWLSRFAHARAQLFHAVNWMYPVGSFVKVKFKGSESYIFGKVQSISKENPDVIGLVLEHGFVRFFNVGENLIKPTNDVPEWFREAVNSKK